jgi:hypothetical protein
MTQPSSPTAVVIDASVVISICSNEATFSTATNALSKYASMGCAFYAPHVLVSEVLYVLCVKLRSLVQVRTKPPSPILKTI